MVTPADHSEDRGTSGSAANRQRRRLKCAALRGDSQSPEHPLSAPRIHCPWLIARGLRRQRRGGHLQGTQCQWPLVVGAAVAAACFEGQCGARAASSGCPSAAGSASGRFWPLACGRNLGGLVGRLSSTGTGSTDALPTQGTGPRTWQGARRTARLKPGRWQQQRLRLPPFQVLLCLFLQMGLGQLEPHKYCVGNIGFLYGTSC
jgi:hypothetical protein